MRHRWQIKNSSVFHYYRNKVQHLEFETVKQISILLLLIKTIIACDFEEDDSSPGTDEEGLMDGGLVDIVSLGKGRA